MEDLEGLQDKALQTILQTLFIEVDQETLLDPSQFHVRQHLRLVHWCKFVYAFQFQQQFVFDKEIQSVPAVEVNTLVLYGQWVLHLEADSADCELSRQALLISRFQQSGAQGTVNLDSAPDDAVRKFTESLLQVLHALHGEKGPSP